MKCPDRMSLSALGLAVLGFALTPSPAGAQAHFSPGVANIRDYSEPPPGLYLVVYNYGYQTDRLNDDDGNRVSSVTLGPSGGPNLTLGIDPDVNIYALAPTLIWVTRWKVLGANYGAFISPAFSNSSLSAALFTEKGRGLNPAAGQFAPGDLYVMPVWLGWNRKHFDTAVGYGFYAPVGRYDTTTFNFPVIGQRTVADADNTGLGYWTNELQGNVTWYPSPLRFLAITNTLTAEFNTRQRGFDVTQGNFLTWNWGASMYVPLAKKGTPPKYLLELGLAGYDQWQISDTTGSDARNGNLHQHVYAVGLQAGITYAPKGIAVNFRYMDEYSAANRFQGHSYGLNAIYTIKTKPPAPAPHPPAPRPASNPPGE